MPKSENEKQRQVFCWKSSCTQFRDSPIRHKKSLDASEVYRKGGHYYCNECNSGVMFFCQNCQDFVSKNTRSHDNHCAYFDGTSYCRASHAKTPLNGHSFKKCKFEPLEELVAVSESRAKKADKREQVKTSPQVSPVPWNLPQNTQVYIPTADEFLNPVDIDSLVDIFMNENEPLPTTTEEFALPQLVRTLYIRPDHGNTPNPADIYMECDLISELEFFSPQSNKRNPNLADWKVRVGSNFGALRNIITAPTDMTKNSTMTLILFSIFIPPKHNMDSNTVPVRVERVDNSVAVEQGNVQFTYIEQDTNAQRIGIPNQRYYYSPAHNTSYIIQQQTHNTYDYMHNTTISNLGDHFRLNSFVTQFVRCVLALKRDFQIRKCDAFIAALEIWKHRRDVYNRTIAFYIGCFAQTTDLLRNILFNIIKYDLHEKDCFGISISEWMQKLNIPVPNTELDTTLGSASQLLSATHPQVEQKPTLKEGLGKFFGLISPTLDTKQVISQESQITLTDLLDHLPSNVIPTVMASKDTFDMMQGVNIVIPHEERTQVVCQKLKLMGMGETEINHEFFRHSTSQVIEEDLKPKKETKDVPVYMALVDDDVSSALLKSDFKLQRSPWVDNHMLRPALIIGNRVVEWTPSSIAFRRQTKHSGVVLATQVGIVQNEKSLTDLSTMIQNWNVMVEYNPKTSNGLHFVEMCLVQLGISTALLAMTGALEQFKAIKEHGKCEFVFNVSKAVQQEVDSVKGLKDGKFVVHTQKELHSLTNAISKKTGKNLLKDDRVPEAWQDSQQLFKMLDVGTRLNEAR